MKGLLFLGLSLLVAGSAALAQISPRGDRASEDLRGAIPQRVAPASPSRDISSTGIPLGIPPVTAGEPVRSGDARSVERAGDLPTAIREPARSPHAPSMRTRIEAVPVPR